MWAKLAVFGQVIVEDGLLSTVTTTNSDCIGTVFEYVNKCGRKWFEA